MSSESSKPPLQAKRIAERFAALRPVSWFIINVLSIFDRPLLRLTGGRFSLTGGGIKPLILVETIGAKSGQLREIPLAYVRDGPNILLIASCGGSPRNPAWYYNLVANPQIHATLEGQRQQFVAHEALGAERQDAWAKAIDSYSGFKIYQDRTGGRQIPVIVLAPVS